MNVLIVALGSLSDPTVGGSLLRSISIGKYAPSNTQVDFLTTSGGKRAILSEFKKARLHTIVTPVLKDDGGLLFYPVQILSILLVLFQFWFVVFTLPKYSVLYLDGDGLWDLFPALLYRFRYTESKIVVMNHHLVTVQRGMISSFLLTSINKVLQTIAHQCISRYCQAIFVLDTEMGQKIASVYHRLNQKLPIYFVRNGIDGSVLQGIAHQKKNAFEAVFFGYLRPSKGLFQIIKIWELVCKKMPKAKLLILGGISNQYLRYVQNEIKTFGLQNNVVISKYVSSKTQAIKMLKSSRISISPALEEGWGIALMESQAAGLPGVAWNLSTYRKIFRGSLLVAKRGDVNDFARQIMLLLTDANLRKKMKLAAMRNASQYEWSEVVNRDYQYFSEIAKT